MSGPSYFGLSTRVFPPVHSIACRPIDAGAGAWAPGAERFDRAPTLPRGHQMIDAQYATDTSLAWFLPVVKRILEAPSAAVDGEGSG